MRRPFHAWAVFAACTLGLTATLAWLSMKALELDRAEAAARTQAALEENSRLALWRMDSATAALVARESATPVGAYAAFVPLEADFDASPGERDRVAPSPLLLRTPLHVRLHFESLLDGALRSPQVPQDEQRAWAVPRYLDEAAAAQAEAQLAEIRRRIEPTSLAALLPAAQPSVPVMALALNGPPSLEQEQVGLSQSERNANEFQVRAQLVQQNVSQQPLPFPIQRAAQPAARRAPDAPPALQTPVSVESPLAPMTPVWIGEELFLARKATVDGAPAVQGCWLDWPAIRTELLASVSDLLPAADLVAASPDGPGSLARRLATLPVRLEPGALAVASDTGLSPIAAALLVAWGSLACLIVAVGALLRGVVTLSERRAAFVSAVTHELRTPLTTFRLYAEMLADDMVPREADRRSYLNTLRVEADRLMHLVENVLAYARLERGARGARLTAIEVHELLQLVDGRLQDRARQAGRQLEIETGDAAALHVLTDPAAVEQILFNLVDNACKYGASSDRRIRIEAEHQRGRALIAVRDFGPGIDPALERRLFQPFHKSARDAADSAPGVGLGLALCRRLARELGGELRLDGRGESGACFVLELPIGAESENRASRVVSREASGSRAAG